MAGAGTSTTSRRHRLQRDRRRRAVVAVAVLAVLVGAIGAGVLVRTGGDHPEAVVTPPDRTPVATARSTTTTAATSPERIEPAGSAEAVAATLVRVERGLRGADRDPARLRVLGWEQQLTYRQLSNHPDWVAAAIAALPPDVAPWVRGNLDASAALSTLTTPATALPDWSIVAPPPPEALRAYYAEAEEQSGIPWAYLAAIHFLETRMGRIHGNSTEGAQGPMQFIPSTWQVYGDGDVHDDRDAILAAGRYLSAAGGPGDLDAAIYSYNHDQGYVAAVKAYAENLLADPRAYDGYYYWQVYYRTVDGTVLLPEGFTAGGPIGPRSLPPA